MSRKMLSGYVVSGGGDGGGIDLKRDVEERGCEGRLGKHLKLPGG